MRVAEFAQFRQQLQGQNARLCDVVRLVDHDNAPVARQRGDTVDGIHRMVALALGYGRGRTAQIRRAERKAMHGAFVVAEFGLVRGEYLGDQVAQAAFALLHTLAVELVRGKRRIQRVRFALQRIELSKRTGTDGGGCLRRFVRRRDRWLGVSGAGAESGRDEENSDRGGSAAHQSESVRPPSTGTLMPCSVQRNVFFVSR